MVVYMPSQEQLWLPSPEGRFISGRGEDERDNREAGTALPGVEEDALQGSESNASIGRGSERDLGWALESPNGDLINCIVRDIRRCPGHSHIL